MYICLSVDGSILHQPLRINDTQYTIQQWPPNNKRNKSKRVRRVRAAAVGWTPSTRSRRRWRTRGGWRSCKVWVLFYILYNVCVCVCMCVWWWGVYICQSPPSRHETYTHIYIYKQTADLEEAEERLQAGCKALGPLVAAGAIPGEIYIILYLCVYIYPSTCAHTPSLSRPLSLSHFHLIKYYPPMHMPL